MSLENNVEKVIKGYFDCAVFVDDELNVARLDQLVSQRVGQLSIKDEDLGDLNDDTDNLPKRELLINRKQVSAASDTINNEINSIPDELLIEFIDEGIVTFPFKFTTNNNLNILNNVIQNTKLLILDWELEGKTGNKGDAAKKLLDQFTTSNKGIKCCVIYTHASLEDVILKMKDNYTCNVDEDSGTGTVYFEPTEQLGGSPVIGFIMSKSSVSPKYILKEIGNALFINKTITLHLMDTANRLDNNLDKTLENFNSPFEKVLFSQLITSDIEDKNLSNYIGQTLLSSVIDGHEREITFNHNNFIYAKKRLSLIKIFGKGDLHENSGYLGLIKKDVVGLMEIFDINTNPSKQHIPILFDNNAFVNEIGNALVQSYTLDKLKELLKNKCTEKLTSLVPDKISTVTRDVLLLIFNWDCFRDESAEQFKKSFKEQTVEFTKILKYSNYDKDILQTGSIIKYQGNYLLCITPLCDTIRPANIDNYYKFIVGEIKTPNDDHLKNNSAKNHYLAIPIEGEIKYLRLNFYQTLSFQIVDLSKFDVADYILTLKHEYVHSIMNKYIAYQSRAGVEEVFYKESDYIKNFNKLLHS